jgi:riboflavin transporter FmnP
VASEEAAAAAAAAAAMQLLMMILDFLIVVPLLVKLLPLAGCSSSLHALEVADTDQFDWKLTSQKTMMNCWKMKISSSLLAAALA